MPATAASDAAGYGALRGPAPDSRPTWGISAAGGQALDGLGRRVRWDFVAESGPAYKAEVVRDVVGRVARLTFGETPSATAHWRGYGYDPATRLSTLAIVCPRLDLQVRFNQLTRDHGLTFVGTKGLGARPAGRREGGQGGAKGNPGFPTVPSRQSILHKREPGVTFRA